MPDVLISAGRAVSYKYGSTIRTIVYIYIRTYPDIYTIVSKVRGRPCMANSCVFSIIIYIHIYIYKILNCMLVGLAFKAYPRMQLRLNLIDCNFKTYLQDVNMYSTIVLY